MARYKGHEGAAKVDTDAIGEVESFDIDLSTNELDVNVMGSDWTDVEGGQKSASGTVSVLSDPADAGQAALTVGSTVSLSLYPQGETSALEEITGDFLVTNVSRSSSVGDLVKTTYSVRNKGTVTVGAVTP